MSNKYHQVMEHLELSDNAKERILQNVSHTTSDHTVPFIPHHKHVFPLKALCSIFAVFVFVVAIIPRISFPKPNSTMLPTSSINEGIPFNEQDSFNSSVTQKGNDGECFTNPITECNSTITLSKIVGFDITSIQNDLPFTVTSIRYYAYNNTLAEIIYENDANEVTYRKSYKEEGVYDISGVYMTEKESITIVINNISITLSGHNHFYQLATYSDNTFTYSIYLDTGSPKEEWITLLNAITY